MINLNIIDLLFRAEISEQDVRSALYEYLKEQRGSYNFNITERFNMATFALLEKTFAHKYKKIFNKTTIIPLKTLYSPGDGAHSYLLVGIERKCIKHYNYYGPPRKTFEEHILLYHVSQHKITSTPFQDFLKRVENYSEEFMSFVS